MRRGTKLIIAVVWVLSLAAAGVMAEAKPPVFMQKQSSVQAPEPEVVAGPDVGFRIDHYKGGTPVGELVVKKDGKWVPIEFGARVKLVK